MNDTYYKYWIDCIRDGGKETHTIHGGARWLEVVKATLEAIQKTETVVAYKIIKTEETVIEEFPKP